MDNRSRFFKSEMERIQTFLDEGEDATARDLMLELRLDNNIGLYYRAYIGILLAKLVSENSRAHYEEAMEVIAEMRAGGISAKNMGDLEALEREAAILKEDIEAGARDMETGSGEEDDLGPELGRLPDWDTPLDAKRDGIEEMYDMDSSESDKDEMEDVVMNSQMTNMDQNFADTTVEEPASSQTTAHPQSPKHH